MRVKVCGQVMKVGKGVNRDKSKEYTFVDIYDGDSLVRVYGYPTDGVVVGQYLDDISVNLRSDTKIFVSAIR